MKIDFDLDAHPIEIRTNSKSGGYVWMLFYTSQGEYAGRIYFKLTPPPQYYIYWCKRWTNFPTDLPTARVKVWRITVIRSTDIIGLQILCNGEEVLNTALSDSMCTKSRSSWYKYWSRDIEKIKFSVDDTISEYYRAYYFTAGRELIIHNY